MVKCYYSKISDNNDHELAIMNLYNELNYTIVWENSSLISSCETSLFSSSWVANKTF